MERPRQVRERLYVPQLTHCKGQCLTKNLEFGINNFPISYHNEALTFVVQLKPWNFIFLWLMFQNGVLELH